MDGSSLYPPCIQYYSNNFVSGPPPDWTLAPNTWDYILYHLVHGQTQVISGLAYNPMGLRLILLLRYYPSRTYTSHRGLIPALEPTDDGRAQPGFPWWSIGVNQKSAGNSLNYLVIHGGTKTNLPLVVRPYQLLPRSSLGRLSSKSPVPRDTGGQLVAWSGIPGYLAP